MYDALLTDFYCDFVVFPARLLNHQSTVWSHHFGKHLIEKGI